MPIKPMVAMIYLFEWFNYVGSQQSPRLGLYIYLNDTVMWEVNKAHGWDDVSVWMIQLCGKSIALPLKLLFKTTLE